MIIFGKNQTPLHRKWQPLEVDTNYMLVHLTYNQQRKLQTKSHLRERTCQARVLLVSQIKFSMGEMTTSKVD